MTGRAPSAEDVVRPATLCAFAMIANQVAGKATRDALFLSSFDVELLPRMVGAAAIVTIGAVVAATRLLPRLGPRRLVPAAFAGSAVVQLGIRALMDPFPAAATILLYLHISVFGAVLISWFWSMITERFDPHTARLRIGRIAGGGTVGGLLGGIAAERAATALPVSAVLLFLAALHFVCAGAAWAVGRGSSAGASPSSAPSRAGESSAWTVLRRTPYLRNLALLVLSATAGGTLLDFVFKLRAQDAFADSATLLRFFAVYYTGVSLVTFLLQSLLTRRLLETAGLARSASVLPGFLGLGGLAALLGGGLPAMGAVRGLEAAIRSSLFRSSYELFYTPLPPSEKRATKTLVDVGFDRLGDTVGAMLVQLVLAIGIAGSDHVLLVGAAALGVVGLLVTRRLHSGYVAALERNLVRHSEPARAEDSDVTDQTAFLEAVSPMDMTETVPDLDTGLVTVGVDVRALRESETRGETTVPVPAPPADPLLETAAALRSREPARVRPALRSPDGLAAELVPFAIPLLAWDAVAGDAQAALRAVCDRHVGQIVDALLDPDQEFTVRRRLPQVLARSSSPRAVAGLVAGLRDRRFEVRYQCGTALARVIGRHPGLAVSVPTVHDAVLREAKVDRRVWESHRLLDEGQSPFSDEVLRERTSRSLEHVFTLLSLVYPARPLRIAYRGLHTGDEALRGTSLEYLESILPAEIRDCLWPFLDDRRVPGTKAVSPDALDSLLRSHDTIQLRLDELRREADDPTTAPGDA